MKKMLLLLLLTGLSATAGAGQGAKKADWWLIGREKEPYTLIFLDRSSIAGGKLRRAWTQWVLRDRVPDAFQMQSALDEFDCAARRVRRLRTTFYMWDGRVVSEGPDKAGWDDMIPSSNIHQISLRVCNGLDPKKHIGPIPDPPNDAAALFDLYDRFDREKARKQEDGPKPQP